MTDLDEIMSKDPVSMTTEDIDAIIAYQRRARAQTEGTRTKAKKEKGPAIDVDLKALVLGGLPPRPTSGFKRRV